MLSAERQRRLVEVGVFALPIVLLRVTAMMFGGQPETADAGQSTREDPIVEAVAQPVFVWDREQIAAAEHVRALREEPFGVSPLRYRRAVPTQADPAPEVVTGPLRVRLSGIIDGTNGAVAFVDGEPRRVGDTVEEHRWEIIAIDVEQRLVRFRHTSSADEVTLVLPTPR